METKLSIYACGGCGSNIAQKSIDIPNLPGFPIVQTVLCDISDSNLDANRNVADYIIPGAKGAGKVRKVAYGIAKPYISDILNKFPPGSFNFILTSATGGTGAVIAHLLAEELTLRNLPYVVFVVGGTASHRETTNCIDTIKGFVKLSRQNSHPILFKYYENIESTIDFDDDGIFRDTLTKVDHRIKTDIRALALLISESHHGLDRNDIKNWANYTNSTEVSGSLTEVIISTDVEACNGYEGHVITTASLLLAKDDPTPSVNQPYRTSGTYKPEVSNGGKLANLHFLTTKKNVKPILNWLDERNEAYLESAKNMEDDFDIDLAGDSLMM